MLSILLLIAGFVFLIVGANALVDGSSALAKRFNIPNMVIGLTIVAFGTSSPELVVSLVAAINHNTDIVLGNVLGSNIFNVLFILGLSAIIYPLSVKTNTTWYEVPLSFLAAVLVLILANDIFLNNDSSNTISRSDGIVLLCFFIIFLVYNINLSKNGDQAEEIQTKNLSPAKSGIYIVAGLVGLVVGGKFIVMGSVNLAHLAGLSERIIGLTIVSIGTSLPELATSLVAVRKRNVDMAIGNVVGSNIFNIFFILGLSTTFTPLALKSESQVDLLTNVLGGFLVFVFIFTGKGRKLERWEGIIFILMYLGYLFYLIKN